MRPRVQAALGVGFAMVVVGGAVLAAALERRDVLREEIGSATATVKIVRPGSAGRPSPTASPSRPKGEGPEGIPAAAGAPDEIVDIRLVRIIPQQGNNPFNQREPINNRDGQIVADGLQGSSGADFGSGLSGCAGQSTGWAASGTAPPDFRFAGIEINPNTGACRLRADGSSGLALIFQSPAEGGTNPLRYEFFVDALEMVWTQVDPVVGLGGTATDPGIVHTVTIRATTGLTVRIQFVVTGTNKDNFQLMVQSITRL